jgi:hypothetical protein
MIPTFCDIKELETNLYEHVDHKTSMLVCLLNKEPDYYDEIKVYDEVWEVYEKSKASGLTIVVLLKQPYMLARQMEYMMCDIFTDETYSNPLDSLNCFAGIETKDYSSEMQSYLHGYYDGLHKAEKEIKKLLQTS